MAVDEKSQIKKLNESGENPVVNFFLKISIKEVDLVSSSIASIFIKEWIFDTLPRIEIEMSDTGWFTDGFPLEDNDTIKIELHFQKDDDPIVKNEFILQDYEILNSGPGKSEQAVIRLSGFLKTDGFPFELKTRAFSQMKSEEVFKKLSNEIGFKDFTSRVSSRDKMTWLQANQNDFMFMKHVLERAYVNDDDAPFAYVDRDGKMTYTSLKTEMERKQQVKQAIFDLRASMLSNITISEDEYDEQLEELKETHGEENIIFYRNWGYKNFAGTVNKTNSYGRAVSYYDLENSKRTSITTDDHPLSIHSLKEKSKIGKIVADDENGLFDSTNMHASYMLAQSQNKYLRENFFSSHLVIYARPESDLRLFDKVNVWVPSMFPVNSKMDDVHSGEYVVGGIIHEAQKNSIYTMVVVLYRNGLDIRGFKSDLTSRHSSEKLLNAKIDKRTIF